MRRLRLTSKQEGSCIKMGFDDRWYILSPSCVMMMVELCGSKIERWLAMQMLQVMCGGRNRASA